MLIKYIHILESEKMWNSGIKYYRKQCTNVQLNNKQKFSFNVPCKKMPKIEPETILHGGQQPVLPDNCHNPKQRLQVPTWAWLLKQNVISCIQTVGDQLQGGISHDDAKMDN
jgi:hypothetical protein